jgi:hypothetical protein
MQPNTGPVPRHPPHEGSSVVGYDEFLSINFPNKKKISIDILVDKNATPFEIYESLVKESKNYFNKLMKMRL